MVENTEDWMKIITESKEYLLGLQIIVEELPCEEIVQALQTNSVSI